MDLFQAAVVQFSSGESKTENVESAIHYVSEAAGKGCNLVVLPEFFSFIGPQEALPEAAEPIPGPTIEKFRKTARELQVAILCGSIAEISDIPGKVRNTSVFISETGEILAKYRKIHLFDIDLPGEVTYRESTYIEAGEEVVVFSWHDILIGLAVCYDLRFPELFRRMMQAGAQVVLLPAAFTLQTGRYHWQPLLRARAIENQVYLCAANQKGENPHYFSTYGHSAIIDPWGRTLCEMPGETGISRASVDLRELKRIRTQSPILTHTRPWLI